MPHSRPASPWQGQLWLGTDYCLISGQAGETGTHAHYPHQLLIACAGEVEAVIDGVPVCGAVLSIESGRAHAIVSSAQPSLTLYVEPLAFDLPEVRRVCADTGADAVRLIAALAAMPRRSLQPRLAKALQRIRQLDADALPATEIASEAALSLSQLERLFSGELGLSVRRLVLWQRLRFALQLALSGYSLTNAAATAGFADSAHLSRCVRQHFGIRADRNLRHLHLRVLG